MQFTNRIGHSLVWVSGPVLWLGDAAAAPPPHLVAPHPPPHPPKWPSTTPHPPTPATQNLALTALLPPNLGPGVTQPKIFMPPIFQKSFLFVSQIGLFMKLLINPRTAAVTVGKKKVMVGNPSQTHAVNFPRRTCHTPDSSLLFGK